MVLANIVGNNAAAALMFPVAADAADKAGTDELSMAFNVMLAASASFSSPFGYQVRGVGGGATRRRHARVVSVFAAAVD